MASVKNSYPSFSADDQRSFEPALKVGLLASINPDGLPHLTLISSLMAGGPQQVVFGQFIEGQSKDFLRRNPQAAFLIMTLDKNLWRGRACFSHTADSGPEFERFNSQPMFRYNAYFGIHTVYYLDLLDHTGREALPMAGIAAGALQTRLAALFYHKRPAEALNLWTRRLLDRLGNLKFLAYVGADGFPWIIPVLQAQTVDREHLLFAASPYRSELESIPADAPAALFGLSLSMEAVLVRGIFQGLRRYGGVRCGLLKVDWVYNCMPPKPGQIYPELPIESITSF